jgi:hypothetical protein
MRSMRPENPPSPWRAHARPRAGTPTLACAVLAAAGWTLAWTPVAPSWAQGQTSPAAQPASPDVLAQIEEIARRWAGSFDNHRQVDANIARGEPAAPELTRERRQMKVHRLDAPQIGRTVLYYEEFRDTQPGRAHRQRVVSLVFDARSRRIRAEQWFFKTGPTYDRKPLEPAAVARLAPTDFTRQSNCDLYFDYEESLKRFRGGMLPRACVYEHEVDGMVYADFEMLLYPGQLWYRDRSIRLVNGTVRGEIDGFSWLLFDRSAPASAARHQGVWKGTFRRYDADGRLTAEFPSEIIARVEQRDGRQILRQTNRYSPAGAPEQVIESSGEIRDGRVWFENDRLSGWSMDIPADTTGRGAVIVMDYKDGSGQYVYEIVARSADGRRRSRATQYLKDGAIVRRTLIDEEKVTDDWRAYEAANPRPAPAK